MEKKRVLPLLCTIAILLSLQIIGAQAYTWTSNPEFDNNGYRWLARTWQWNLFGGYQSPSSGQGSGIDYAHFELSGSDTVAHLKADYDDRIWTVCAGVTQGWAWFSTPPSGIYQPPHLDMDPGISSLHMYTDVYSMSYSGTEYGILSDSWFRAFNVVYGYPPGPYTTYPQTVFGIDFYYRIGGLCPSDRSFLNNLPTGFSFIKYNLGSGWRDCDIRAAAVEAGQLGPNFGLYFNIWDMELWEVENVVEENYGLSTAKFKYLSVSYYYSLQGDGPSYPRISILIDNEWVAEDSVEIDRETHTDVHVITNKLDLNNGFYKLKVDNSLKTTYIDNIQLIAFNSTNVGYEVPLSEANIGEKDITTSLGSNDGVYTELQPGESLQMSFKPKETQISQPKYVLIIIGKQP